jgi:hypothetical protein
MTDKELLELAAKAAGIEYDFICPTGAHCGDASTMRDYFWNPLTSDGDALRLAVRLKMELDCDLRCAKTPYGTWHDADDVDDDEDAMCLAIVRAAADIGKEME